VVRAPPLACAESRPQSPPAHRRGRRCLRRGARRPAASCAIATDRQHKRPSCSSGLAERHERRCAPRGRSLRRTVFERSRVATLRPAMRNLRRRWQRAWRIEPCRSWLSWVRCGAPTVDQGPSPPWQGPLAALASGYGRSGPSQRREVRAGSGNVQVPPFLVAKMTAQREDRPAATGGQAQQHERDGPDSPLGIS
jgi:hypothetical protein